MTANKHNKPLLNYMKSLSAEEKQEFAEKCETSVRYLMNIAYGVKPLKEWLAIKIDVNSGGLAAKEKMLPNVDWSILEAS